VLSRPRRFRDTRSTSYVTPKTYLRKESKVDCHYRCSSWPLIHLYMSSTHCCSIPVFLQSFHPSLVYLAQNPNFVLMSRNTLLSYDVNEFPFYVATFDVVLYLNKRSLASSDSHMQREGGGGVVSYYAKIKTNDVSKAVIT
jgi:hypothetical protein